MDAPEFEMEDLDPNNPDDYYDEDDIDELFGNDDETNVDNIFDVEDNDEVNNLDLNEQSEKIIDVKKKQWKQTMKNLDIKERDKRMLLLERKERRRITNNRKSFFRNNFKQEINILDGDASEEIIRKGLISVSPKTGKIDGIEFKNVKVIVKKGKNFVLSENSKNKKIIDEFNELMKTARIEHEGTANDTIEDIIGSLPGTSKVNGIRLNVINKLEAELSVSRDNIDETQLNTEELRELGGLLATNDIRNLDAVKASEKYWRGKAKTEVDLKKKTVYKNIEGVAKLKAEELRLKNNIKPVLKETLNLLETDELTKFQKLKTFAKENFGTLSEIAIGIGGIITVVTVFGKKGLTKFAKDAAKAAADLAKMSVKLAQAQLKMLQAVLPVLTKLMTLLSKMLFMGSKGLLWLTKNMWLLAIAFAYILYKNVQALLPRSEKNTQ